MPQTTATIGVTGTSAHQISYGDWSDIINYEHTSGDCKVRINSIVNESDVATDLYGTLTINYELEDDRNGEIASVKFLYSTSGSAGPYVDMDEAVGGSSEGTNNLSTSLTGQDHIFEWNTVTSLGIDYKGNVHVKLRAYDRTNFIGDYMESEILLITIDNAPRKPVITYPTEGWFEKNETPYIKGTIPDPRSGYSNLHIKLDIATDSSFNDIELSLASAIDQTGWEYYDGAAWNDIPVAGIPVAATPALVGKEWKVTLQTEDALTIGQKYIRASCGGILV